MHILVVNDDGPPSPHSSPYVHTLVRELQGAGHTVSVVLPHTQRSWIGKAHMIGQTVKPTYYRPPSKTAPPAGLVYPSEDLGSAQPDLGTTHARPATQKGTEEWILVDGTPASCVQIGLYHFFKDRGPIDLIVSGPNYGRNTTSVFALSSGTLGGALEAAGCKRRAIAVSYAFQGREHNAEVVAEASRHSVRVIEKLAKEWPTDGSVDVYSVNVPLVKGVSGNKTLWTEMLQNYWGEGSCFQEVDGSDGQDDEEEERIREAEVSEQRAVNGDERAAQPAGGHDGAGEPHTHKHFKWAPRFTDVYKSVDEAPPGNDGWAVREGLTSVTPLKASFHPATSLHGKELHLEPSVLTKITTSAKSAVHTDAPFSSDPVSTHFYAYIAYEDAYVQPLLVAAMELLFSPNTYTLLPPNSPTQQHSEVALGKLLPDAKSPILQIAQYESIDFSFAAENSKSCLINSYIIRKALIRKHFLSVTVDNWVAKNPQSVLKTHVKRSEAFEVDYAEFLDDALMDAEAFDLRASMERTAEESADNPASRQWWILKPGMSDRGEGIRLFSTMEDLQAIFDGWEEDEPSEYEDEDAASGDGQEEGHRSLGDGIRTSHLRHFVAQPYIHPPLLLPGEGRKFHIRTYVLAVGGMQVYVFRDMLALFAQKPYQPPWTTYDSDPLVGQVDLEAHLTNTCIQGSNPAPDSVRRFWDLPLPATEKERIFSDICAVTGEIFEAAARAMTVHFQPLAHAFEVFGFDYLVDADGTAWLLEVNAFPDFRQTGTEGNMQDIVAQFWAGVLRRAVVPWARRIGGLVTDDQVGYDDGMVLVREVDLGRRAA